MTTATPDYQSYLKGTAIERDFATRRELPIALAHEFVRAGAYDFECQNISRMLILDRLWGGCRWDQREACHAEMKRIRYLGRHA